MKAASRARSAGALFIVALAVVASSGCGPDLMVDPDAAVPYTIDLGAQEAIVQIANVGNEDAGEFVVHLKISGPSAAVGARPEPQASRTIAGLAAGATHTLNVPLAEFSPPFGSGFKPTPINTGLLEVSIDAGGIVEERDEDNNYLAARGRTGLDQGDGPQVKGCSPCRPDPESSLGGTQSCEFPGTGLFSRPCQWPPPPPSGGGGSDSDGGPAGCFVSIEGPVVTFGPNGAESIYATVQSFDEGCAPQSIRLRQNRRFWFDRTLSTRSGSGESTLTVRYECRGRGHMRVFAEAFVRGQKHRSSPRGGISVPFCS